MTSQIKSRLRPLLPGWLRDVYNLARLARAVTPSPVGIAAFVGRSMWNGRDAPSRLVAITPDTEIGAVWVRPFTSDLQMIGTLTGPDGEYHALRRWLKTADTIIDLGSNVGFSLRLWTRWFPAADVIAVEPDAGNLRVARRNVEAAASRVTLLQNAVSDRPGTLHLTQAGAPWGYQATSTAAPDTVPVEAVTMPELIARLDGRAVDLLKCDIEGAERPLFKSCRGWIDAVRTIVVETHAPYSLDEMQQDLIDAGSRLRLVHSRTEVVENSVGIFVLPDSEG